MFIFLINLESSRFIIWLTDNWNAGPFLALGGSTGYRCINHPLTRKCLGFKWADVGRNACFLSPLLSFLKTLPLVEARVVPLVYVLVLPLSSPIRPNSQLSTAEKTMAAHSCLENPMDGGAWYAAVHGVTKSWRRLSDFTFTFHFPALEKEMATHSSVLAWRVPGTGGPGGLPSMGSHRVGHD